MQWELPREFTGQVFAYHVLVYREGYRMESPPMWVTSRVYNLSNLHLAAGTYYVEVSIHDSWKLSSLEEYNIICLEKTKKLAVTGDWMHAMLLLLHAVEKP